MRVPYNWLQDYLSETLPPPAELADMLTLAGLEVESIERAGTKIEQVVAAQVKEIKLHPEANHLLVVQVDAGPLGCKQVITSAQNLRPGLKVPLAFPGASLASGEIIEATRFRGLQSDGMLCSASELGFTETDDKQSHGILVLPDTTTLGANVADVLDLGDIVLDLDITPNRADCLSLIGVAREVAAAMGIKLVLPPARVPNDYCIKTPLDISIADPDLCWRYIGAVISNISITSSPTWLKRRLSAAGMRPINSIVDITNYVMLETGQPLHAFDYNKLAQRKIIVRRARPQEVLVTLDGIKRELTEEMLVIADSETAQALAGIMGGLASEITTTTNTVFLESACFASTNIRRTARSLGMHTEASFRYERIVDPEGALFATQRALTLLQELGVGEIKAICDVYPQPILPQEITLNTCRVRKLIGAPVENEFIKKALERLQLSVVPANTDTLKVTIPTFRSDLKQEADLVEEVARLYGFDRIPAAPLMGKIQVGKKPLELKVEQMIKSRLQSCGLDEVQTYSFVNPQSIAKMNLAPSHNNECPIPLLFPLSEEQSVLRTTLTPSLLEVAAINQRRKARSINIFEINRVYLPKKLPLTELPNMPRHLAVVLAGNAGEKSWHNLPPQNDFYRLKGIMETVVDQLGVSGKFVPITLTYYHPGRQAGFEVADHIVATFGELHPNVAEAFGLTDRVYTLELDLSQILPHINLTQRYQSLPRFPGIERDLALIVPESVASAAVMEVIINAAGPYLADIMLFDVYQGAPVPTGYKSLAYSLVFRASDHTLAEEEVSPYMTAILQQAEEKLGASIRH
ncbi:MAG: phenylalanine--tRNA ligase subunit beta [Firmicutes bacterium]|nr:phenylalanine--tRNA ligase subunit beta [Bacillota bacterium]